MSEKYTVMAYNTCTGKYEEIEVTKEIQTVFKRTNWNIKDNDESFYKHEIQISSLIGGADDAYENFDEFIDEDNTPDKAILKELEINALNRALASLNEAEQALMQALYYKGMTIREYSAESGIPIMTVQDRKKRILRALKNFL